MAARCADIAEDGDDRDRIGRRHDGAQHETGKERHAEGRPERQADHDGGDEDADDGKEQHRSDLFGEALDVNVERRLEQQSGQEDIEQRLGSQIEPIESVDHVADDPDAHKAAGEGGESTDRAAHRRQQDGIGNRQPVGQRQQQADQPEQPGERENGKDDIVHSFPVQRRDRMRASRAAVEPKMFLGVPAVPPSSGEEAALARPARVG